MKILKDEIVTMDILRRQGETNQAIAKRLGISEGSVRYHLKRMADKARDGRAKTCLIERLGLAQVVDHWWQEQVEQLAKDRSPNISATCCRQELSRVERLSSIVSAFAERQWSENMANEHGTTNMAQQTWHNKHGTTNMALGNALSSRASTKNAKTR